MSVARSEAVAIFPEHCAVSLKNARKATEKAGFEFLGADIVARGELAWAGEPGASDLLLKDRNASMILRLTASDTESMYDKLADKYRQGNLGDTVQVHGSVLESKKATRKARERGAQFSLAVTDWAPGTSAKLPPLVAEESTKKEKETSNRKSDGWF